MTITPIRARCVNCETTFRFKRNKSGRTIRNNLQIQKHWPFVSALPDGKIGCLCFRCLSNASESSARTALMKKLTEKYGQFNTLNSLT